MLVVMQHSPFVFDTDEASSVSHVTQKTLFKISEDVRRETILQHNYSSLDFGCLKLTPLCECDSSECSRACFNV